MTYARRAGLALAAALAPALLAPAARAAVVAAPTVNVTFAGTGTVSNATGDAGAAGEQVLTGSGNAIVDLSGAGFTTDSLTLYFTPVAVLQFAQPNTITVMGNNFAGFDTLSTAGGSTLNLSLAGTFTGPSGTLAGVGGEAFVFTGTATETGGTGVFSTAGGTLPFLLNDTETPAGVLPSGVVAPRAPNANANYTATYGPRASAVPEPSSFALLALGLLPAGLLAARKRRASHTA